GGVVVRSRYMMRRRKKDVVPQLLRVIRQVIPLSDLYHKERLWNITVKIAELYGFEPHRPPFRIDTTRIPFELLSEIRRETGAAKREAALNFIREQTVEYPDKVVIFAHHKALLEELPALYLHKVYWSTDKPR